ncbi:hypothetical protein DY245_34860 [Streptomyces inhibens]|uniref:Uncharacterized protein n=1 Tax=Streptomyces inhibens TaxID=2293571 RepID=A0A371PUT2_STRIH|nr:hypothetical protein [Streptomyces inhibens]REK86021.1 hypothetical protein DY245_34860 [Streptomyces inhibens]
MLLSASILQQIGFALLFALGVLWAVGMIRLLRRGRYEAAMRRDRREMRARYAPRGPRGPQGSYGQPRSGSELPGHGPAVPPELLGSVPRQTGPAGPPSECVELSAAERETFEELVRQLTSRS